jgi:Membrane bound O-acyl transferase family
MDALQQPATAQNLLENVDVKYSKWIITFSSLALGVGIIPRFIHLSPRVCRRTLLATFDIVFAILYLPRLESNLLSTLVVYSGFVVISSSVLGFFLIITPSMKVRWAALPLLLSIQLLLFAFVHSGNIDLRHSAVHLLSVHGICIWLLHITALLYIEQFTLPPNLPFRQQLLAAYKVLYNIRRIGLPTEAPDIRTHRLTTLASGSHPQSRLDFTLSRTAIGLLCWALCDNRMQRLIVSLAPELQYRATFLPSTQQPSFMRRLVVSDGGGNWLSIKKELRIKTVLMLAHFGWSVASLTGVHTLLALIFVSILHLDSCSEWPLLFSSPIHVTSLRSFWRQFWHSMLYRGSVTYARLVALDVLRLPSGGWWATVVIRGWVFVVTAGIHVFVGQFSRTGCEEGWETVAWWMAMFGAMILENIVSKWVSGSVEKMREGRMKGCLEWVLKCPGPWIGRAWVFVFLLWTVGKLEYLKYYCWGNPERRLKMLLRAMEEPPSIIDVMRRIIKYGV